MSIEEMIGKENLAKGRYWKKSWGLVSGCTPCSPGCTHCRALAMERRFRFRPYPGDKSGLHNNSIQIHPERLDIPLKRKKPTVFALWNDLFHEDVKERFIAEAWDFMTRCLEHKFLVLTKRPERVASWAKSWRLLPFPNIWIGVTICNQAEADEKIPLLLQIPAAMRWVSLEPLLGPIDLSQWFWEFNENYQPPRFLDEGERYEVKPNIPSHKIQWLVCGGETGPGARPMHPDWVRSIRNQCQAAGVPFFFKGSGEWREAEYGDKKQNPIIVTMLNNGRIRRGSDFRDDDDGLNPILLARVGRKAAGRLLDGRTWNELPIKGV